MKMAYAPLPKLVPINTSNICSSNVAKTTLSEVLQSDPVKRLFNQPNIVIKTIPLTVTKDLVSHKDAFERKNGMNVNLNSIKQPEISIVPVKLPDEEKEDANLLPSKIEDKKSEISLLPVKRKLCGHYEPCENIVCDVAVQQYVDQDGVSPMLAVNIEEDEINAPVSKHCNNQYCDALSIDHNRCRRALIKLHKCDRSRMCDICGITLKGWKSRVYHRNCTRRDEYRHNNVDRVNLLKERMRERELQMLEAAKIKKNNYLDPIVGYSLAMETLRRNEELIIIPKTVPSQQPIVTITSISSTQSTGTNLSNTQSVNINRNPKSIFKTLSFAISSQSTKPNKVTGNISSVGETKMQTVKQTAFGTDLQQNSYVASTSVPNPVTSLQNQCIRVETTPPTNVHPITINNWIVSPSRIVTTTSSQPKSFLTPIRVVPITNLITAPSLLHRTQGIPKFCIMAENLTATLSTPNPSPPQPEQSPDAANVTMLPEDVKVPIQKGHKSPKNFLKRPKNKIFFCVYCLKHFSTNWYFKMHVAKHKGEKLFSCNLCDESFSNRYDMKKHMSKEHNNQENLACDACNYICKSPASLKSHIKTHATVNPDTKTDIKSQAHKKIECKTCCKEFSIDEINHHIMSVHNLNEENMKKSIHKDTIGSLSENKKTFINREMAQDVDSVKNAYIEKHDNKELSILKEGDSTKINGFARLSVKGNSENFEAEAVITSR